MKKLLLALVVILLVACSKERTLPPDIPHVNPLTKPIKYDTVRVH